MTRQLHTIDPKGGRDATPRERETIDHLKTMVGDYLHGVRCLIPDSPQKDMAVMLIEMASMQVTRAVIATSDDP